MNARLRRLYADHQKVQDEFTGHPYIDVVALSGNPPEAYQVTYHVPGLRLDRNLNRPVEIREHRARINLHMDYPREKPNCVMDTEIFHPNIGAYICIDDYWAAGESISDVIIQIGEMVQYQNFNVKSPLNAVAARWAEQNKRFLPVGHIDLYQPEVEIDLLGDDAGEPDAESPHEPSAAKAEEAGEGDVEIGLG